MNVAAAVMVMADRDRLLAAPIRVGIRNLVRGLMDRRRMVIVIGCDQRNCGPVRSVSEVMLRLRYAVQVHGRQEGDAQTDAEMAKGVIQISGLRRSV